ncbi:MAG TPA: glycosyltransferase [Candidatus Dormibacteraeota bacterium]|nr:glycosyltransferase [Candidatus Dormibacteraeota bacterium]
MLRQIASSDSKWRIIEREASEQGGLGTAVSTGMALAIGDAICVMDGDLQHPPSVISRLLQAMHGGADLLVASRYTAGGSAEGLSGPLRKGISRAVSWVAQLVFAKTRRTTDPRVPRSEQPGGRRLVCEGVIRTVHSRYTPTAYRSA